jgi:signal transduction histidine kinase
LFEQFPDSNALESALRGHTSHWEKSGTVYIASPVRYEAETRAVLILSAPMAPAYEDARQAWLELGVAVLPVLLLVLGASWWFGRTLSRPIQQLHASVLQIADGDLDERVDATTRDEIGELGRAVNFMAERLNLLINAQRSFVSNAAHELRTPLMNLKLRIDALQEDLSLEQRQAYLREATQEVEHMANLVTKLLALARLDEGRYAAPGEAYDLVALLHDLTRQWRIQASNAQLRFETSISNTLPDCRVAASDLRMILDNVLGNAVKYTPQGGQVRFCASQEGQTIRFEVIDSGAGFAAGDVDRLFERFFRTDDARQLPGTGLGLSIVQAMVEHYDGTITAASDGPGLGAHFTIILPAL